MKCAIGKPRWPVFLKTTNRRSKHMKTYLVTGGAGFIGSNFVLYMLEKYKDITIVNVDKLTYAGNLENLKSIEGDKRHVFVQADICDREVITALFGQYDFDIVIKVPSAETPRIQECQTLIGHIICCIVEENIFGEEYNK